MLKAIDIANYIVWYACNKYPEIPLTHLKLQKIIYYFSVVYSRQKNSLPFEESIRKWQYGPVVPSVYEEFKVYGANAIKEPSSNLELVVNDKGSFELRKREFSLSSYTDEVKQMMGSVIDELITLEPFDLVDRTHEDFGWKNDSAKILAGEKRLEYSLSEIMNSKYPNYS